ncbi:MAG: exodeoxyribonuclease [Pseudomonadota bacterium]|jgi:exodeoxyribonuclease-3
MRVISLNLNGIRSAANKGFLSWLEQQQADIVCLQELKAQNETMKAEMLSPLGFYGYFHYAEKKGYSGVGIYSRHPAQSVVSCLDHPILDQEGRYLEIQIGNLTAVSLYLPSGSSSAERQIIKFSVMEHFQDHLQHLRNSGREVLICGDWNIAHRQIDLKNWRSNQKNPGFLPEERAWLDRLFDEQGWVDVYRKLHPATTESCYTWWSNRGQAWANNVGWRIDYQIATPELASHAKSCTIYKEQRFSDHAPLIIDYDIDNSGNF